MLRYRHYVPLHMPEISESLWQMPVQVQQIAKCELHMEVNEKNSHKAFIQKCKKCLQDNSEAKKEKYEVKFSRYY